jgi:hypothetical protein
MSSTRKTMMLGSFESADAETATARKRATRSDFMGEH